MARWAAVLALAAATAIAVASVAGGDMSADKTECADQLVGLAPCLQYVQGQARAPPPDCCGGLRQVLGKSPKCLCVLVKDKDDPNLGIKINATLALALPNACGATRANVSHCARTSSLSSSFSRPASASEATRPPPGPGVAFLTASFFSPQAKSCLCHFILFYFWCRAPAYSPGLQRRRRLQSRQRQGLHCRSRSACLSTSTASSLLFVHLTFPFRSETTLLSVFFAAKDNSTATTDSRALQATTGRGVSSSAATAGAALTVLLAGYLLLLVPELSPSSF